jgi:hypothetical protein
VFPRSSAGEQESARRPVSLILVYTWDIVRAIFALLGALAAFADQVSVGGRVITQSTGAQIVAAVASASLAASLFVIGTLLIRRSAWVRRAQIVILAMDAAIALGSVGVYELSAHAFDLPPLLITALFSLVDLCAVTAMTSPRVSAWFREPGPVPLYVGGLIAFWAATSVALVLLRSF